jgi:hypothetical protein
VKCGSIEWVELNYLAAGAATAVAVAGRGATREASDAGGAGREGSTRISIFMGRSVRCGGTSR